MSKEGIVEQAARPADRARVRQFFEAREQEHSTTSSALRKRLALSSSIRLVVFLIMAGVAYLLRAEVKWVIATLAVGLGVFLWLVARHGDLKRTKALSDTSRDAAALELQMLKRDFHNQPDGSEFLDPQHAFAQDIDLFGRGSFYQYIARSKSKEGAQELARILTANDIEEIPQKQDFLQELAARPLWREQFMAVAQLIDTEVAIASIVKWLGGYKSFVPSIMKWLPSAFSILSLVVIAGYSFDMLTGTHLLIWFFVGLGITGPFLKGVNGLSGQATRAQGVFAQYYLLVELIESIDWQSPRGRAISQVLEVEGEQASATIQRFAKLLGALDQRNNMLFGVLGNGFLLWDLRQCYAIEQWIEDHAQHVEAWFETIAQFEARCSLANYVFTHPENVIPNIAPEASHILNSSAANHPLIAIERSVSNDVQVGTQDFFIITGANMAGKSTFLRTVSLQIVMANVGLPVCASACIYSPIKLITSMRSVDDLSEDTSYFYSELKRLKFIVDRMQQDRYFIVLDEILKGTNSKDKAEGSRQFVERLVKSGSAGIIATHDLSLCVLADQLDQVENHYFDADISNDELSFDYRMREGICENMNASFLLNKMGIV